MGKKSKSTAFTGSQVNKMVFGVIFIILGIAAVVAETQSLFGAYLFQALYFLFGPYYKFIFSPVATLFGVYLIKERGIFFDFYRLI